MTKAGRSLYRAGMVASASIVLVLSVGVPDPAQAASSGIKTLLVRSGEMPGFVVRGTPETATTAAQWVTHLEAETGAQARQDVQRLRSTGFVAGAYENLGPKNGGSSKAGGSTVLWFRTSAGARKYVAAAYAQGIAIQPKAAVTHSLKVGISGARAFSAPGSGPRPAATSNAYFSSGRCLFVVGDFIDGTHPNTAAPVIAASKSLDRRVGGPCR